VGWAAALAASRALTVGGGWPTAPSGRAGATGCFPAPQATDPGLLSLGIPVYIVLERRHGALLGARRGRSLSAYPARPSSKTPLRFVEQDFEQEFAMELSHARILWRSQCEVVPSIRERFGLEAALDYVISEKLLNFAQAAVSHPDFSRELPMFVAEIRRLFTPDEISEHLAVLLPRVEAAAKVDAEAGEDAFEDISPQELAARVERLRALKQVLEVAQLGTS